MKNSTQKVRLVLFAMIIATHCMTPHAHGGLWSWAKEKVTNNCVVNFFKSFKEATVTFQSPDNTKSNPKQTTKSLHSSDEEASIELHNISSSSNAFKPHPINKNIALKAYLSIPVNPNTNVMITFNILKPFLATKQPKAIQDQVVTESAHSHIYRPKTMLWIELLERFIQSFESIEAAKALETTNFNGSLPEEASTLAERSGNITQAISFEDWVDQSLDLYDSFDSRDSFDSNPSFNDTSIENDYKGPLEGLPEMSHEECNDFILKSTRKIDPTASSLIEIDSIEIQRNENCFPAIQFEEIFKEITPEITPKTSPRSECPSPIIKNLSPADDQWTPTDSTQLSIPKKLFIQRLFPSEPQLEYSPAKTQHKAPKANPQKKAYPRKWRFKLKAKKIQRCIKRLRHHWHNNTSSTHLKPESLVCSQPSDAIVIPHQDQLEAQKEFSLESNPSISLPSEPQPVQPEKQPTAEIIANENPSNSPSEPPQSEHDVIISIDETVTKENIEPALKIIEQITLASHNQEHMDASSGPIYANSTAPSSDHSAKYSKAPTKAPAIGTITLDSPLKDAFTIHQKTPISQDEPVSPPTLQDEPIAATPVQSAETATPDDDNLCLSSPESPHLVERQRSISPQAQNFNSPLFFEPIYEPHRNSSHASNHTSETGTWRGSAETNLTDESNSSANKISASEGSASASPNVASSSSDVAMPAPQTSSPLTQESPLNSLMASNNEQESRSIDSMFKPIEKLPDFFSNKLFFSNNAPSKPQLEPFVKN